MIVDLQNYSSNPAYGVTRMITEQYPEVAEYYVPRVPRDVVAKTRRLLDAFRRRAHREVVFTRHGALLDDGRDMISRRRRRDSESLEQSGRPTLWAKGEPGTRNCCGARPFGQRIGDRQERQQSV